MTRLLLQYLEPSVAVERADPAELADRLAEAIPLLHATDVALGWGLRGEVLAAVRSVIPVGVALWRWVPTLTDSGTGLPADGHAAIGADGHETKPYRGMCDFRFLCPDHDEVIESGLERAVSLAREVEADGVLVDRIRWDSPSQRPETDLTCFCRRSRDRAAIDGLDLDVVAEELESAAGSLEGRRSVVAALLGKSSVGALAEYLSWRCERITAVAAQLNDGLQAQGLETALDVFTPALACSVGQNLAALGRLGEWSKSMTYLDAVGPASMLYELRGYAAWLEAAGEDDAAAFLSRLLGFDAPGLAGTSAHLDALGVEVSRLESAVGQERAVVGLDSVEIPGICEVSDADLAARIGAVRDVGLGLAPSWDLLAMGPARLRLIAEAVAHG